MRNYFEFGSAVHVYNKFSTFSSGGGHFVQRNNFDVLMKVVV